MRRSTLGVVPRLCADSHWRAVCVESAHALFGEGLTEKGQQWYLAGSLLYSEGGSWKRPVHRGTSLAAYPTSRTVLQAGGDGRLSPPS